MRGKSSGTAPEGRCCVSTSEEKSKRQGSAAACELRWCPRAILPADFRLRTGKKGRHRFLGDLFESLTRPDGASADRSAATKTVSAAVMWRALPKRTQSCRQAVGRVDAAATAPVYWS